MVFAGIQFVLGDLEADTTPSCHVVVEPVKIPAQKMKGRIVE